MRAFGSLGSRGQIGRLRRLGQAALARYGIAGAPLTPLRHQHNTTFRAGAEHVLRISRPGLHAPAAIGSEMAWLRALRDDRGLGVPDPVAATDGAMVVVASDAAVPEPRACVLLRRLEGRFADARLTPLHMRRVARLAAALHDHAEGWTPPPGFTRPRLDRLATRAQERARCIELVAALTDGAAVVSAALDYSAAPTPGTLLIHGDLHQENYLFGAGEARAIDFDDCGWGDPLFDLAVTLWEIEDRPDHEQLREALLDEYAAQRPLPHDAAARIHAFQVLRRVQALMWVLESREHAAFRDGWRGWACESLRDLAEALP
jgi:Ser/Thr protein kinase RdoA (MazF antagonist)